MKHMNIIKKAAGTISIFLLILSLTACGNAISENASSLSGVEGATKNTEGISLKGHIKLQGAVPARSATSSFSDNITWVINATSSDFSAEHGQLISGAQASALTSEKTFSMKISKEGTYAFTVLGYPGSYSTIEQVASKTPLFQGYKTEVEITETGLKNALVITVGPLLTGTTPQSGDSPIAETSDSGTINLLINDSSESISKLSATLTAYQREMDPIIKETTFDGGETTLHIENVPAGKYTAKLDFSDSDGNVLYSCNEAMNVYTGMTTDTWFGTAPYLTDGVFVITSALINKFGADRVPSTDMVLYNKVIVDPVEGYKTIKYFLTNDASLTISDDTTATVETGSQYDPINYIAFDSNGYFYTVVHEYDSAIYIKSNKPGFGSETYGNTVCPNSMYLSVNCGFRMAIDRVNDFIYFFDPNSSDVTQLTNDDGEYIYRSNLGAYDYAKSYSFADDPNHNTIGNAVSFAVHNGVAYFPSAYNNALIIADLKNASDSKEISLGLSNMGVSSSAEITDIIYQDGSVYMLLNDTNDDFSNNFKYYSRGAVVRYNCLTGAVTSCGWTNAAIDISGKVFYAANGSDNDKPFLKENINSMTELTADEIAAYIANRANWYTLDESIKSFSEGKNPALFSPTEAQANKAFYGPKKFIAIKPKKLVIADEGCAFYTDSNDAFCFKNVNRVVTVDLESFAISSDDDISATFDEDKSGDMVSSGYTEVKRLNLSNCIYSTTGNDEYGSTSSVSVRVRIPLGE